MDVCYALRRGVFYPHLHDPQGTLPPKEQRARYLKLVKSYGFDAVELPAPDPAEIDDGRARDLGRELRDAGVPVVCLRQGGPIAHPKVGPSARQRLERAVRAAHLLGARVVNTTFIWPLTHPGGPGSARHGEPVSQGASRLASERDYELLADRLRPIGQIAGDLGVDIAVHVHHGSIVDNSWSMLHLLDLVGLGNVGANPDLANIHWHYDVPEETCEQAIVALAPRATYWRCKNLRRLHLPELQRSEFIRVPLDDGDIDYRFAIAAMLDAGYQGHLAVEGMATGDQLTQDARSLRYVRAVLADLGQPERTTSRERMGDL
jgi:sugar phosphate isomerase/epimerase